MALAQQVQLQRDPGARADIARRVAGSPALQLVGRRLLTAIPVLLGVTFLTFVVMNLIPGNPAQLILGINASPSAIAKLDHQPARPPMDEQIVESRGQCRSLTFLEHQRDPVLIG